MAHFSFPFRWIGRKKSPRKYIAPKKSGLPDQNEERPEKRMEKICANLLAGNGGQQFPASFGADSATSNFFGIRFH
jgi:hypothetical protein